MVKRMGDLILIGVIRETICDRFCHESAIFSSVGVQYSTCPSRPSTLIWGAFSKSQITCLSTFEGSFL